MSLTRLRSPSFTIAAVAFAAPAVCTRHALMIVRHFLITPKWRRHSLLQFSSINAMHTLVSMYF